MAKPILSNEERKIRKIEPFGSECYWCGDTPVLPDELIPVPGNPLHQSIVLKLRRPCCHVPTTTEYFGTILDYLCDGWARAQLICKLYNEHVGLINSPVIPRPKK